MVLKVFVLGLPRSATTMLYKRIYMAFKRIGDVIGVFEPTNFEVIDHIMKGIKHVHDTEGDVPYDYHRLPKELLDMIYENSKWHLDWTSQESPKTPFLGGRLQLILDTLDTIPFPVVLKDVHMWVIADRLVTRYRHAKFIFTSPDLNTYIAKMKKRYGLVRNPLDKAGIGKFLRFFSNNLYSKTNNEETMIYEATAVWSLYQVILSNVMDFPNVRVLSFRDRIPDSDVYAVIRWCLGG